MQNVIPTILETDFNIIRAKVETIKPYADLIQLDVMDGVFVPNRTFLDTEKIATLDITLELHLMIDRPTFHIRQWALPNVKRMIFHYEAGGNIPQVVQQIRAEGKEAWVALNPVTPSNVLDEYLQDVDGVLVMGVNPGLSGQDFQRDVLEKIKELKAARPDLPISVDGGMNPKTARWVREAGADMVAVNSSLWQAEDIGERLQQLAGK